MHVPVHLRSEMENGRSEKLNEVKFRLSSRFNPMEPEDMGDQVRLEKETEKISRSEFQELDWVIALVGPVEGEA
jgi:hypothetical protein